MKFGVSCLRELFHTIPQPEIDAEARALIVEHGDGAISVAERHVERAQWSKGSNDAPERTARVLKAVRKKLG